MNLKRVDGTTRTVEINEVSIGLLALELLVFVTWSGSHGS